MPLIEGQPLRILHATRAPVGGIFRHILDLANGQADPNDCEWALP